MRDNPYLVGEIPDALLTKPEKFRVYDPYHGTFTVTVMWKKGFAYFYLQSAKNGKPVYVYIGKPGAVCNQDIASAVAVMVMRRK